MGQIVSVVAVQEKPARQSVHADAPSKEEKVPPRQLLHELAAREAKVPSEKVPLLQMEQVTALPVE